MAPNAILCITGSELTRGETRDLNGSFLAAHLSTLGLRVEEILFVPDDPDLLAAAVERAIARATVVVLSGGLGPTQDDHTVAVLARVFGRGVYRHPEAMARMKARALARGLVEDRLPSNYWKQSEVIEGAEVLLNTLGLAPGMIIETKRGMLVVLPGVPRELQAMFRLSVSPVVSSRLTLEPPRILRGKILGLGESWAEARIQELGIDFTRLEYGISAKPGELMVKFVAHRRENQAYLDEVRGLLMTEFGEDFIPLDEGLLDAAGQPFSADFARIVHEILLRVGVTVSTAESCTGGLIAKHLTDNEGSSKYFLGSVVAYENAVKESLLGVSADLLSAHGAVSEEVCGAMAQGARRQFSADYALAATGIAGPSGGTPEKPVGLVYVGIAGEGANYTAGQGTGDLLVERHNFWGNRENVRTLATVRALDLLRRVLNRRLR